MGLNLRFIEGIGTKVEQIQSIETHCKMLVQP